MKSELKDSPCLNKLLGHKLTPDLRWDAFIKYVARDAARKVGSFYRSRDILTPSALLYLYRNQIRPCMEYCCHLRDGSSQYSLPSMDRIPKPNA